MKARARHRATSVSRSKKRVAFLAGTTVFSAIRGAVCFIIKWPEYRVFELLCKLSEKGVGRGWHKQSDRIVAYLPPLFDDRTDREPFLDDRKLLKKTGVNKNSD